jgi:hypothetical protein
LTNRCLTISIYEDTAYIAPGSGSALTPPEVTGRDGYIIARALYEFIRLEQSKPIAERRGSDEQDAKAILHARFDNELEILVKSDEAAGREPPHCERKASIGG